MASEQPKANEQISEEIIENILEDEIYPVLNSDGFIIFIEGKREKGKTDIALLLAEICYMKDFRRHIATNIHTESYMVEKQITNLPDLRDWLNVKGRKLFVLDEAGKHLGKLNFMTKKNKAIMEAVQLIRHFDCGFIACTLAQRFIDSGYVDPEVIDLIIRKVHKDYAIIKNNITGNTIELFTIPRTSINFNSKDIANFDYERKPILTELPLCCQVAYSYSVTGSYAATMKEFNLQREQIRRLIREHCSHPQDTSHIHQGG